MKLVLEDGATYGYDAAGKRVCTGSRMGRRNWLPYDANAPIKLRLTPLRFVGQCYDQRGAYWGMGDTIYCAWTPHDVTCREHDYGHIAPDKARHRVLVFVWARSRAAAKSLVIARLPNATFFR